MRGRLRLIAFMGVRALRRVLRRLPEPLVRRVGGRAASAPETSALAGLVPQTAVRVLIGPANSAGQGWLWARAIEREIPDAGAVAMSASPSGPGFGFPVDQSVAIARYRWSPEWARAQRAAAGGFTHVLAESGRPLFGDAGGSAFAELDRLRRTGIRVGLVFHGSDLRSPRRHAASSPWSPFGDDWEIALSLELRARENLALARRLGAPVFVTTPDLLDELPSAHWLPVIADTGFWATTRPVLERDRLIVAHAPSSARMKGTALVEPTLLALEADGTIEYRRIERVPAAEMPARYAEVDIVLDQFRLGAYGVAAVEALASGRLVVGRVDAGVRERVEAMSGRELPIVEADPSTIGDVLRGIAADRDGFRDRAAAGPVFAADVHGGAFSVRVLRALLDA